MAIDLSAQVNLFPRNANDTKKNVQVVLEVHKILIEYSNDLT